MKAFHCACGQRVFFENTSCLACGAALGFDPLRLDMRCLPAAGRRPCRHGTELGLCNWLVPADDPLGFCAACRLNEVIPNLAPAGNLELWGRLEAAKRRLLYTLFSLALPVERGAAGPGLRFRFLEDRRRNPDVLEDFVATGHVAGTITVNLAEADDRARNAQREAMGERYRTVLGHLRHEAGHYFLDWLAPPGPAREAWRALFGDERRDYAGALAAHYANGPPTDWPTRFVSAYAAAHPHEDWAETFAHFLHIVDALETARAAGLAVPGAGDRPGWIPQWMRLSVMLNELNRSLGVADAYPFVLTDAVIAKLELVSRLVSRRSGPGAAARAAGEDPRRRA